MHDVGVGKDVISNEGNIEVANVQHNYISVMPIPDYLWNGGVVINETNEEYTVVGVNFNDIIVNGRNDAQGIFAHGNPKVNGNVNSIIISLNTGLQLNTGNKGILVQNYPGARVARNSVYVNTTAPFVKGIEVYGGREAQVESNSVFGTGNGNNGIGLHVTANPNGFYDSNDFFNNQYCAQFNADCGTGAHIGCNEFNGAQGIGLLYGDNIVLTGP